MALLLFDSDSKYFTFVFLNFLFNAFPTAFYLFLFPMSCSYEYSNQQSTAYATICERGLFMHRDTNNYIFWGAPEFQGAYRVLFISFSFLFYVDSLVAGASKTQENTLKVFII